LGANEEILFVAAAVAVEIRSLKHRGLKMMLLMAVLMSISGLVPYVVASAGAQQKELRPLRVNVFRVDAAMAAAKARGLFAAEGLDVAITTTPNSTEQMRGISRHL
jgi:ABC-type nitrate/sulfonate/bicarbonate transport system substrate-binding protein